MYLSDRPFYIITFYFFTYNEVSLALLSKQSCLMHSTQMVHCNGPHSHSRVKKLFPQTLILFCCVNKINLSYFRVLQLAIWASCC